MGSAPLALAFAAGMLATINPCGFAMLPAYLSYFVGLEGDTMPAADGTLRERALGRALAVAGVMTLGFVVVFALMGLVIVQVSSRVQQHLPFVTIAVGVVVMGLGVAAVFGHALSVRLPHLERGTSNRELPSMFLFGVSYALSSLSCTIAPFLATTSATFTEGGLLAGITTFVAYGLGMGAIVALLTVAVALARTAMVKWFSGLTRHVTVMSGVLMVGAGVYLAYYGWYEIRLRERIVDDPVVDRALAIQQWLSEQVGRIGEIRIGVLGVATVLLAAVAVRAWRFSRRSDTDHPRPEG